MLSQPEPGPVIRVRRLHVWWRDMSEQWLTLQLACCGRPLVSNRVPVAGMELAPLKGRAKPSHLESSESALILAQRLQSSSACATDASTGAEGKACDLGACQSPGARRPVSSVFAKAASSSAAAEDTGASRRLALLPLRQEDSASELHRGGRSRHSPRCCERVGNECTGAATVRGCQAGLAAEPVAGSAAAVFACGMAAPAPDRHARAGKGPALSGCKSGETDVLLVGGTDCSSSGAGLPAEEVLWYRQRQVVLTLSGYGCALVVFFVLSHVVPRKATHVLVRLSSHTSFSCVAVLRMVWGRRSIAMLFNLLDEVRLASCPHHGSSKLMALCRRRSSGCERAASACR